MEVVSQMKNPFTMMSLTISVEVVNSYGGERVKEMFAVSDISDG